MSREEAYAIVQILRSMLLGINPREISTDLISKDSRVTQQLSSVEIETCFDPQQQLGHLEEVYQRLGI